MMKKLTVILTAVLVALSFTAVSLQFAPDALAAPKDEICEGIGQANSGDCGDGAELTGVVESVINIFSMIVGIVAVIMIMVAGFKYVTSGGDSSNITSAKHTLIYAIIGIVVVALAQTIVQFVVKKV